MAIIGLLALCISAYGFISYTRYAPMYNTTKSSVDKLLRLTGTAYDESYLIQGVDVTANGTEPGTYAMGLTADKLYIDGNSTGIKLDVIDGTLAIDGENELTVFVIGNRATYPFDENTSTSLVVEGYTTIPENLSDYGVTLTLKEGKEAKAQGGSRAKPYAMKLKEASFDVTAEDPNLKVKLIIIDGCLTLDKEGETTVTVMGNNARYAYDGTEKTLEGLTTDAPEGTTVDTVKAAAKLEIFCMTIRMLCLVVGIILLTAGLLYFFLPENAMVHYILKRLGQSLLTIALIVSVVFVLMRLLPTEYYFNETELIKLTDQQRHDKLEAAGLLDPIPQQLGRFWYNMLVRFDLGTSRRIQSGIDVVEVIGGKLTVSMKLGLAAFLFSLIVGVVLGILQARYKDGALDKVGTGYTIFVNAVPSLVSFTLILAVGSRVFDLPARYSSSDPINSSILPMLCLSLGSVASYMLWMRRYMVDELNKDYIRLAKLKGLSTTQVMFRHVMKNAFLPLAQYLPYNLLLTIGGSLLVERFFSVPGLGPLLTDAISRYDCNIVQAIVMFYAVLGILGLFLGDLLMTLIDPRISLTGKGESR